MLSAQYRLPTILEDDENRARALATTTARDPRVGEEWLTGPAPGLSLPVRVGIAAGIVTAAYLLLRRR